MRQLALIRKGSEMRKKGKRFLWLFFCLLTICFGVGWLFIVPSLIINPFWKGVFYPFAGILFVGHWLTAITVFWYSVIKGE